MDFNKFTLKSQEVLNQAQQLASNNGNQAIENGHLLKGIFIADKDVTPYIFGKLNVQIPALEGALDAIITIDQNGIVLFFNEAAENLWKMRKEQIINKNVNTLLPEEYKNQHNTFIKQYLASGIKKVIGKRIEKHIIDSTGKKIPILLTIAEAKVAEQFTFTAFIQNISVELF